MFLAETQRVVAMTDNIQKKSFDKKFTWIRCVIIGEAAVFGYMIVMWVSLWSINALLYGMLTHSEYYRYFTLIVFFPFFIPAYVEMFFLQKVLNIQGEEMMLYIIPMFASLVLWWIFLGVVLGSVIYRVRMYLQRKSNNHIDP